MINEVLVSEWWYSLNAFVSFAINYTLFWIIHFAIDFRQISSFSPHFLIMEIKSLLLLKYRPLKNVHKESFGSIITNINGMLKSSAKIDISCQNGWNWLILVLLEPKGWITFYFYDKWQVELHLFNQLFLQTTRFVVILCTPIFQAVLPFKVCLEIHGTIFDSIALTFQQMQNIDQENLEAKKRHTFTVFLKIK